MSIKLNSVIVAGNLVKDPIVRELQGGVKVADLRLAVENDRIGSDGNRMKRPCYVDVTVWRKQAELAESYLKKGRGIIVEGRLDFEQWADKEGHSRNRVFIVCSHFTFLPKSQEKPSPEAEGDMTGGEATSRQMVTNAAASSSLNPARAGKNEVLASGEDEIPF